MPLYKANEDNQNYGDEQRLAVFYGNAPLASEVESSGLVFGQLLQRQTDTSMSAQPKLAAVASAEM